RPLPSANSARLTLPAAKAGDDGARLRCVVSNSFGSVKSVSATLRVLALRSPVQAGRLLPGLAYDYFEGRWDHLPPFDELKPARRGTVAGLALPPSGRRDHFGLACRGFLEVRRDGAYSFWLGASGPCKLFVGGAEVAGTGNSSGNRGSSGVVGLK